MSGYRALDGARRLHRKRNHRGPPTRRVAAGDAMLEIDRSREDTPARSAARQTTLSRTRLTWPSA